MPACLPASCLPACLLACLHVCMPARLRLRLSLCTHARDGQIAHMPLSQLPTHHPACSKDVKAACGSNVAARHALCHLGANATTTFGRATSGGQLQRHSGARCGSALGCHDKACRGATRHGPGGPLCAGVARPTLAAWLGKTAVGAARRACLMIEMRAAHVVLEPGQASGGHRCAQALRSQLLASTMPSGPRSL